MWKSLALAAVLLLPGTARTLDWAGQLGFSWTRQDSWTQFGVHDRAPVMDLDLGLKLRGYVLTPEVVTYRAAAGFRLLDRELNGTTLQRNDTYTYSVGASLFQRRGSPFSVVVDANRIQAELSGADGRWIGSRTSDSGSVTANAVVGRLPTASATFAWSNSTDEIPGMADHERDVKRLYLVLGHSSPAFSLSTRYSGEWSDGSWLGDAYQVNSVAVQGSARLGAVTTFSLSDQYTQRTPGASFDAALASENHQLQATVRAAPNAQEEAIGQYIYSHATMSAPSISTAASTGQTLSAAWENRIDDSEYSLRPTASVAMYEQSLGAVTARSTGETLAAMGRWYHKADPVLLNVLLGPSVSLLQTDAGENRVGYGASAAVVAARPFGAASGAGNYEIAYGKDSGGLEGWTLRQTLAGSIQGPVGAGTLTGQLQLSSSRASTPLFGESAARTLNLIAGYNQGRNQLRANLGFSSGLAVSNGQYVGDGLLFTPFDSHSLFAGVSASTQTLIGIAASLGLTYGTSFTPGQPDLTQYGAVASLGYTFAQFSLSLQDTLTAYEYPTGRVTTNLVAIRLARAIGGGF